MREKELRIEITITGECVNCIEFTVELLKGYKKLCLQLDELKRLKDTLKCEINDKTSYSERSLKYKRSEAVKSIAITLFGSKVFKEEEPNLFNLINT